MQMAQLVVASCDSTLLWSRELIPVLIESGKRLVKWVNSDWELAKSYIVTLSWYKVFCTSTNGSMKISSMLLGSYFKHHS